MIQLETELFANAAPVRNLKAALGGEGYVEVDSNPNPLRDLLATPALSLHNGTVTLSGLPGLGVAPDLDATRKFRRRHRYA